MRDQGGDGRTPALYATNKGKPVLLVLGFYRRIPTD